MCVRFKHSEIYATTIYFSNYIKTKRIILHKCVWGQQRKRNQRFNKGTFYALLCTKKCFQVNSLKISVKRFVCNAFLKMIISKQLQLLCSM